MWNATAMPQSWAHMWHTVPAGVYTLPKKKCVSDKREARAHCPQNCKTQELSLRAFSGATSGSRTAC